MPTRLRGELRLLSRIVPLQCASSTPPLARQCHSRHLIPTSGRPLVAHLSAIFHVLLRSCAAHGNIDAAILLYISTRGPVPPGALRLLETMMAGVNSDKGDASFIPENDADTLTRYPGNLVPVPSPASSTSTTIIGGFCNTASSDGPKPDIKTVLSWFDRLVQHVAPIQPY